MNYNTHYTKLVERAKLRKLEGYSEKHHIIPKCLGGDNSNENIVRLTPEEHYVAHQLLVKMYPGNHKLIWAAVSMTNQTHKMLRGNKLYGWLRRKFVDKIRERHTGSKRTPEQNKRASERRKGKKRFPHTEETKRKMSQASLGKKKSEQHKQSLSRARIGRKFGPHSPEHIEKIRQSNVETWKTKDKSSFQDKDYKQSQSDKMREIWAKRKSGELPLPKRMNKEK